MGGIYRGALLTIAASRSSSSSEGCFNRHKKSNFDPFSNYTCVESCLQNGETSRLYFEKIIYRWGHSPETGLFGNEVYDSPLSRRAWVYQEQVLSRRTLYFAESQLYWECDHCRLSEDNSQQAQTERAYPVLTFSQPMCTREVAVQWYGDAVETYSKRGLTDSSDKLVAISAVAKSTYLNRHVEYVAGLWQDCILPGLCWYRDGSGRKNTKFRCPSCSWASQQPGVTYRALPYKYEEPKYSPYAAKVVEFQVTLSVNNPFGNVHGGHIKLQTRVTAETVMRDRFGMYSSGFGYNNTLDEQALVLSEANGWRVWQGNAVLDDDGHRGPKVVIALMNDWDPTDSKWLLLLLEQIDQKEQTYKRVGLGVVTEEY